MIVKPIYRHLLALTVTAIAAATTAHAVPAVADCAALSNIERNKTYEAEPSDIQQCIQRGWDPPLNWRPDEGTSMVRATGGGGFSVSGRQPPNRPPGAVGAAASVSGSMFNFTLNIPPWRGFPCQIPGGIDLCGGGNGSGSGGSGGSGSGGNGSGGAGGSSACPIASDSNGTYGQQLPIAATGSQSLPCGGAVPLSTYLMSATTGATGIIATEAGSRTVWIYRAQGSGFALTGTAELPDKVCSGNGNDDETAIQMPIAQIVPFNSSTPSVVLRLALSINGDVYDPFDPDPDIERPYYLEIPVPGGNPQIPSGCPRASDVYRTITSLTAPLTVESATTPGCEGTPQQCGSLPANPTSASNCDAVTTNPGTASCEGTTLFAVLNRPNLMYPPDSTATFTSIEGRTAVLAGSSGGMRLYSQAETLMYFGARGGSFTLPEGGTLKLDNGYRLVMNGPAIVNAAGGQVSMPNGGSLITQDGSTAQNFSNGSSYAPQTSLPFVVRVSRSVELPGGLVLPTQPTPFLRLPVKVE